MVPKSGDKITETVTVSYMDAEERRRLEECAREPIRTPGAVQHHGAVIGFDSATGIIVLASENAAELLGVPATDLLGTEAAALIGEQNVEAVAAILVGDRLVNNPVAITLAGKDFDMIVHGTGEIAVLEFEPVLPEEYQPSFAVLYSMVGRLARASSVDELREELVSELCHLTGYDRVMVYHFHPDGHGEVVAEHHAEGMEPYLGLHFPASDIPTQARALYVTKLSRTIASTEETPSALVAVAGLDVGSIDLSQAELRAVSPYHLQYMRNMGQMSTLSISLLRGGELIGMITCAHRTERRMPYSVRRGLEMLAHQAALQINSMEEIEALRGEVDAREIRARLVSQLLDFDDIAGALFGGDNTVLDLVPADGAVVRLGGLVTSSGLVPSAEALDAVVESMVGGRRGIPVVTSSVQQDYPELVPLLGDIAGVLVVPLGGAGDYIAFFREQVIVSVDWLGDPGQGNRPDPLSPRLSFSAWTQSVTDTALPWGRLRSVAVDLAHDLESALLRHAESQLASLALHDPLTGLPNRRLLMERVEDGIARVARGQHFALLFIDLDEFKSINDTDGHEIGDAVIVEVGRRLVRGARVSDTVARIGGDEFVVLCEDLTEQTMLAVADRVMAEVRAPLTIGEHSIVVTISVGIALAEDGVTGQELLHRADNAMYRAKDDGRNRSSL